jgi:5-methylcytosine-specific restriction enzyme subunit McrC
MNRSLRDPTVIEMAEWSMAEVTVDLHRDGRSLQDALDKIADAALSVQLLYPDKMRISSKSYAGSVMVGDFVVRIRPKMEIPQLFDFVRYAFHLRKLPLLDATLLDVSQSGLEDIIVRQLIGECEELVTRGLHRTYVRQSAELASVRGRIDITEFVRTRTVPRPSLPCRYVERNVDHDIHRAIVAGLHVAAALTSSSDLARAAHRMAIAFDGVESVPLTATMLRSAERSLSRLTRAYEPALTTVRLLLEGMFASFDGTRNARLRGFLFDMNRLFQAVVGRFLRENVVGATVMQEETLQDVLAYDPMHNPFRRPAPRIRPDFIVREGTRVRAVLDAKYKDLSRFDPGREILYQLALYATTNPSRRESTVLFPSAMDVPDQHLHVRGGLPGGEADAHVILRSVNLSALHAAITAENATPQSHEYCQHLVG